jgi:hypothetical protein
MEVAVNSAAPQPVESVSITFRGGAELHDAAECFEFFAAQLKYIESYENYTESAALSCNDNGRRPYRDGKRPLY